MRCASSITTSGQTRFGVPSLASSLFFARAERFFESAGGASSDLVFSKFISVTRFAGRPESAMVRRHCGIAPFGQITSTSSSGMAESASQAESVLPRPVRSPSRKPAAPLVRAARMASRATSW